MKTFEFVIVVLYLILITGIALHFRKRASSKESSFWGADRNIGFVVNGFGVFASLVSSASFLGFLGLAYRMGWPFTTVSFGVGSTIGFILCMLLASGPLRRYSEISGKFTLTNFLSERYGTATGIASSLFVLILFPCYVVPQLMGGGLVGSYVLGIDYPYAVILVGIVYVGYVVIGGMLATAWIDFLQGVLMFLFMVGLSIAAIMHFGGLGSLIPQALEVNPNFLSIHPALSPWTYFGISVGVMMFSLSSPHIIMRLFTSKDLKQGRAALSLTAVLSITFHVLGYIGVAAAALVIAPALENIDNTYIVVMDELLPTVLRGFAVAGIIAAIMSTTDAMLLACGSEFSNNVFKKFMKPEAAPKTTITVARVVMILVGVVTMVMAIQQTQSIGAIVALLVEGTGSAFAVPLVVGLWWKRANKVGGFLSVVGGFTVFTIVHFAKIVPMYAEILVSLPASLVFMILGSLLTAPPSKETIAFVESLHKK
jgi:sodium/proline symporter